uniref:Uncharacterized protein n=1 Tax=Rhizophora mucronata TaxID=61149 RepID=A0A2P2NNX2_RHIMU
MACNVYLTGNCFLKECSLHSFIGAIINFHYKELS